MVVLITNATPQRFNRNIEYAQSVALARLDVLDHFDPSNHLTLEGALYLFQRDLRGGPAGSRGRPSLQIGHEALGSRRLRSERERKANKTEHEDLYHEIA